MRRSGQAVAIIGPHGAGKTTLINNIRDRIWSPPPVNPVLFVGEVARQCPFPVGVSSNCDAQSWVILKQDLVEHFACLFGVPVVLDRAMLDQYAYYQYWVGRSEKIEKQICLNRWRYSKTFYLRGRREFLAEDGLRPTDYRFQEDIGSIVLDTASRLGFEVEYIDVLAGGLADVLAALKACTNEGGNGVGEVPASCLGVCCKEEDWRLVGQIISLSPAVHPVRIKIDAGAPIPSARETLEGIGFNCVGG